MHSSGEPQLGPPGPYHHQMPPHQMSYHDQIPTTSHPSWHNAPPHPGLPTPPSYPQHAQQQHYPIPPPGPQQMPPQALTQQQPQIQQQQRPTYSSPSPSRAPSAAPAQNQKFRTEQWINQSWPYAQSPAPPVVPSVMSYHQNDDRMSVLSVNTAITNQYPDSQRCYSSNGSTCENVNPDMVQMNVIQSAEQAIRSWFNTPDPMQKLNMARVIREWMKQLSHVDQGKVASPVDQGNLQNVIPQVLTIVHDGLKPQPANLPTQYYGQMFYYLMDIMLRITCLRTTVQFVPIIIQMFAPPAARESENPHHFRDLFCNVLQVAFQGESMLKPSSDKAFQVLNRLITGVNQEKLRADLAQNLKFPRFVATLLDFFNPPVPPTVINNTIFLTLRFIMSKDNRLKDSLIWNLSPTDQPAPKTSVIYRLNGVMLKIYHTIINNMNNPEIPVLIRVVTSVFEILRLLLHDSNAIDAYVKADGIPAICTIVQIKEVKIAGFKLLLQISDAKALGEVDLQSVLPFIIKVTGESQDEGDVLYCGTGFLSNVVAHKQHVKELAIANNTILLLHAVISRFPRLNEISDSSIRNRVCEIICNCLRTLNNFLMMWIPTHNGEMRPASQIEQQQVCRFIEPDFQKKVMSCLSAEGVDTPALLELRSTILRFYSLLIRTPFIPKSGLLNVIDDHRNMNLVGHICSAFAWAQRQQATLRTATTKQQLVERAINLMLVLMDQCGAEKQVAQYSYSMDCPLNLLNNNQSKHNFVHNVLVVCDKILEHCPTRADIWTIDRSMLEGLTNHRSSDIAKAANSLLSRFPDNDLLAGILSNSDFF